MSIRTKLIAYSTLLLLLPLPLFAAETGEQKEQGRIAIEILRWAAEQDELIINPQTFPPVFQSRLCMFVPRTGLICTDTYLCPPTQTIPLEILGDVTTVTCTYNCSGETQGSSSPQCSCTLSDASDSRCPK